MNDRVNELFECREQIKAVLLLHGVNPTEHSDLTTDLAILVMNWSSTWG